MLALATFQTAEVSAEYIKWLAYCVAILAGSLLLIAVSVGFLALKIVALLTDVKKTFDEAKGKTMPLIGKITDLTQSTQGIVSDLIPKVRTISENAVEISHSVRQTTAKLDVTIRDAADKASSTFADANTRTKVQVARVDGMIASTLSASAEIGATINEGIRVPARRIAALVTQSKHTLEMILDRAKALGIKIGPSARSEGRVETAGKSKVAVRTH